MYKNKTLYSNISQVPKIKLPPNFSPTVCADGDLKELLEKIEVVPQREVACLNEWNNPSNLAKEYYQNTELCKLLSFNKKMIVKLKLDKGLACVLINLNEKQLDWVRTAVKWALHFKVPVLCVPGLCAIMKDKVGLHIETLGIRKNPPVSFLKDIVNKVRDFDYENPNIYVAKLKGQKVSKGKKKVNLNNENKVNDAENGKTKGDSNNEDKVGAEQNVGNDKKMVGDVKKKVGAGQKLNDGLEYIKFYPKVMNVDADYIKKLILLLPYLHVGQASKWDDLKGQTYPEIRSQLIIDRTPVSFLLSRKMAGCVLISQDKFDKLNMKKLVHISVAQRVPVLIVPGLKACFKTATAVTTNCIAIYKFPTDPVLDAILRAVIRIEKRYTFPHADRNKIKGWIDFGVPREMEVVAEPIEKGHNPNKRKAGMETRATKITPVQRENLQEKDKPKTTEENPENEEGTVETTEERSKENEESATKENNDATDESSKLEEENVDAQENLEEEEEEVNAREHLEDDTDQMEAQEHLEDVEGQTEDQENLKDDENQMESEEHLEDGVDQTEDKDEDQMEAEDHLEDGADQIEDQENLKDSEDSEAQKDLKAGKDQMEDQEHLEDGEDQMEEQEILEDAEENNEGQEDVEDGGEDNEAQDGGEDNETQEHVEDGEENNEAHEAVAGGGNEMDAWVSSWDVKDSEKKMEAEEIAGEKANTQANDNQKSCVNENQEGDRKNDEKKKTNEDDKGKTVVTKPTIKKKSDNAGGQKNIQLKKIIQKKK